MKVCISKNIGNMAICQAERAVPHNKFTFYNYIACFHLILFIATLIAVDGEATVIFFSNG